MIRFVRLVVLMTLLVGLVAVQPNAVAVGSVSFIDDYQENADPYIGYNPKTAGGQEAGCDTLDPYPGLTVNSSLVKYKCQPSADIKKFSLKTTTDGFFEATWTLGAKVPRTAEEVLALGADSLTLLMLFENDKSQNSRQLIGDSTDCSRYEHFGPFLTGDGFRFVFFYRMRVLLNSQDLATWNPLTDPASGVMNETVTAGIYYPGNPGWTAPAGAMDPYTGPAKRCDGTTLVDVASISDPGTRATSEILTDTVPGDTVKIRLPMTYHWYTATPLYFERDWVLAKSGHTIKNVVAQSLGTIPLVFIPTLRYGSTLTVPTVLNSSFPGFFDWAPWHGFDMGNYFAPPNFGPRISTGGTLPVPAEFGSAPKCPRYVNLPKSLSPQGAWVDNEIQTNPLFTRSPENVDGLSHYDSNEDEGPRTNQYLVQDHFGPTGCDIFLQGGFSYKPTPLEFTA